MSDTESKPCPYCQTPMLNVGAPIWDDYCPNLDCYGHRDAFFAALKSSKKKTFAELEKLVADAAKILKPFADVASFDIGDDEHDADLFRPISAQNARADRITVGHLRAARKWVEESK